MPHLPTPAWLHRRGKRDGSNRPLDTPFRQQRLPAWQPIITTHSALPIYFSIGIIFIPVGVACLFASNQVQESVIDYTECNNTLGQKCADVIKKDIFTQCICHVPLVLNNRFEGDVYFYYGLNRYWQNLRRYVVSRDDNQLLGSMKRVSADTEPFRSPPNSSSYYAPAGAIANSMFNDSFALYYFITDNGTQTVRVPWLDTGIAWETDVHYKFNNPKSFNNTVKPLYWRKPVYELDTKNPDNNGYKNQDFIVWMRTAALPNFRKLHRRLNRSSRENLYDALFSQYLPEGIYNLTIQYNYPVTSFGARKLFIISTTSWLGSKNPFIGYAYIAVGAVCIVTGVVFLVLHLLVGDRVSRRTNSPG